jgi:hypothetical protein
MPFFKSTYNILVRPDADEVFNQNDMDNPKSLGLPPKKDWDYARELQIEDVDIWEVLYERGGGYGVYASWSPYAEFYMIRTGYSAQLMGVGIETYYGPMAEKQMYKRAKELSMHLPLNKIWVEPEDMWLYQKPEEPKKLILP